MANYHLKDGVKVQFTAEEETQRDAEQAEDIVKVEARKVVAADIATNKASGNQKLLDLGLTQDEIKALLYLSIN